MVTTAVIYECLERAGMFVLRLGFPQPSCEVVKAMVHMVSFHT